MNSGVWLSRLTGVCAVLALAFSCPAAAADDATPPLSDAEYWALADRIMTGLEHGWEPGRRAYHGSVRANSGLLLTHAIAALRHHEGPTRQDSRARMLVDQLTSTPVWLGARPRRQRAVLSTCWSMLMHRARPDHASLEAKVAEALAWAWRARRELRLTDAAARRIVRRLTACAGSRPWQVGSRVANQISWNTDMYASAAIVSGRRSLLVRDYWRGPRDGVDSSLS